MLAAAWTAGSAVAYDADYARCLSAVSMMDHYSGIPHFDDPENETCPRRSGIPFDFSRLHDARAACARVLDQGGLEPDPRERAGLILESIDVFLSNCAEPIN
ncbi:MAG: hypothetical protein ACT4N2_05225 [Hyphomicrobium sp.]